MAFRRTFGDEKPTSAAASDGCGIAAVRYSRRPTVSDMKRTRDETVAPSRRFLLLGCQQLLFLLKDHVMKLFRELGGIAVQSINVTYPSRLDCAISSVKSHRRPRGSSFPVFGSRSGVHSGANLIVTCERISLFFATRIIPSSSNR